MEEDLRLDCLVFKILFTAFKVSSRPPPLELMLLFSFTSGLNYLTSFCRSNPCSLFFNTYALLCIKELIFAFLTFPLLLESY